MRRDRVVILGGGPAGYEAALVAADAGGRVQLVADEGLGGNSVLWDSVPSKALITVAEHMVNLPDAHRMGIRTAADGELAGQARVDLTAVLARIGRLAAEQSRDITSKVEAAGVEVVDGRGELAADRAVDVTGPDGAQRRLDADVVLVATGSSPRVLPFSRPDGDRVLTSRELFALEEVPERLVVVGSGATGMEFAHAFAGLGSDVALISSRDRVLPGEDADAAAEVERVFARRGVEIHHRSRAVDLERGADGVRVGVGDDRWVEGSHALFCIGQVPSADGVGLERAGVARTDRGEVWVDGVSRTSVHGVYAAGDVTGGGAGMMLASVAAMQGRKAMWHALGRAVTPLAASDVAACVFTSPEVATVGMSAEQALRTRMPVSTHVLRFAGNPRAKMEEATDGFVKLHAMAGSGALLGATVVAERASELIAPLSVAVRNRLQVAQLAESFSIYPSMAGSTHEVARQLAATLAEAGPDEGGHA